MKEIEKKLNEFSKPNIERTILAACLQNSNNYISIKEQDVTGDMFLIEGNKIIFYAIEYLNDKNQEPTPITIIEVLKDKKAKETVNELGGVEYISILMEQRVNINSIKILCEKLKQAYTKAKLYEICENSKEFLGSDKTEVLSPTELVESFEIQINDLQNKVQHTNEIYKMGTNAEEILKQRAEFPCTIPGLETGFSTFDYYTNGGQPGDLIMLCARAKTGKSTLLTNWAVKLAIKDKIPILYFDTEMNEREQEDRILAVLSGVPHKEIISGMYVLDTEYGTAEEKKKRLKKAIQELKDGEYYHYFIPTFTIEKVNAISKKFKLQHNIQAIFFDYLKFPASSMNLLRNAQEWQALGFIASGLKDLAGTLKLPVFSACQENRSDPKGTKKDETNVGGSDRILQLASKLIFLTNKSEEEMLRSGKSKGNQTLYVAYQRNGESDCPAINVNFDHVRCKIEEV